MILVPIYDNFIFQEFKPYPCAVIDINLEKDLALIVFNSETKLFSVDLKPNPNLSIGDDVQKIGCGGGEQPRLDKGQITSLNYDQGKLRTNVYVIRGDSGGPLFQNYKVVGVVYALKMSQIGPFPQSLHKISTCIPIQDFIKWKNETPNLKNIFYNKEIEEVIMPNIKMDGKPLIPYLKGPE